MTLLVGSLAQAQFYPVPPMGPGPVRPLPPVLTPPMGSHPGQTQRVIHVNRLVFNETLPLRQLANLGQGLHGYALESVRVETGPAGRGGAYLDLLINGRTEDSRNVHGGVAILSPRYGVDLGQGQTIRLRVSGQIHIARIIISLRNSYQPPRPPPQGGDVVLPLNLSRRTFGNERIDLSAYLPLGRYQGYRIRSMEITAQASYNNAIVDVIVNGVQSGQLFIAPYHQTQSVFLGGAVLGGYGQNLVLFTRGDLILHQVVLRLSPY